MQKHLVLQPDVCRGKQWRPPADRHFASDKPLVPLHGGEAGIAASALPIAVARQGKNFILAAVCGVSEERNLLVSSDGQWLAPYSPAWLNTWPFDTVAVGDKALVVFQTDSGLLDESGSGEPFFDHQGKMMPAVQKRVELLRRVHSKQVATEKALQALAKAKVLIPWSEQMRERLGMTIENLYMVDERALAELDDATFLGLRQAQALGVAYAVNQSVWQSRVLWERLQQVGASGGTGGVTSLAGKGELDLEFLNDSDTIKFGPLH